MLKNRKCIGVGVGEVPLLFTPQKVLSVASADKTTEYEREKN